MTRRPAPDEYAPYYACYIGLVPEGGIVSILETQLRETAAMLAGTGEEKSGYRYAEGKWSLRDVIGHINDTERVFAYRALRIARGDTTPLAGFDQDPYAANSPAAGMSLRDLEEEFTAVRGATIALLRHFGDAHWTRRGTTGGNPVSVKALAWMIAGHERHHCNIIRERYL